ncbi:MAG TPA: lycopene cyclase domain-containing protein [Myxococcaceae bacterium]|nr:lycopene cyclase domain-containing protein [Myxococcaceae bacterium]
MTYACFLGLFVALPLVVLLTLWWRETVKRLPWKGLVLLLLVAYLTTAPWDNVAVKHGLWSFPEGKTWGIRLGYLPLEEYLFFGLQTLLTGLLAGRRLLRLRARGVAA